MCGEAGLGDSWGAVELRLVCRWLRWLGVRARDSLLRRRSILSNLSACCDATFACDEAIRSSFFPKLPTVALVAARSFAMLLVSDWIVGMETSFRVFISSCRALICSWRVAIAWVLESGVVGIGPGWVGLWWPRLATELWIALNRSRASLIVIPSRNAIFMICFISV